MLFLEKKMLFLEEKKMLFLEKKNAVFRKKRCCFQEKKDAVFKKKRCCFQEKICFLRNGNELVAYTLQKKSTVSMGVTLTFLK